MSSGVENIGVIANNGIKIIRLNGVIGDGDFIFIVKNVNGRGTCARPAVLADHNAGCDADIVQIAFSIGVYERRSNYIIRQIGSYMVKIVIDSDAQRAGIFRRGINADSENYVGGAAAQVCNICNRFFIGAECTGAAQIIAAFG